jgi:hypothetical protein
MPALLVLSHHSEPSDPRLLRWVIDTLEQLFGLGPAVVIIPVAVFVFAFLGVLAFFAFRSRRHQLD